MNRDERSNFNSWIDWTEYEKRVTSLENQGVCRSDAQSIIDLEMEKEFKREGL